MISELNGTDIAFSDRGTGPTLLALHGALSSGKMWEPLFQTMPGVRFIAPDLPGHGASADALPDVHTQTTRAMQALIDATGGPVDLVGYSYGGTIALRIAVETPERVRSLTLIEPVFFAVALADDPDFVSDMSALEEVLTNEGRHAATKAFLGQWGGGLPWAMMPKETQDDMASRIQVIIDAGPALYEDTAGMLAEGRMQALDIPVLLLRGSQSPHVVETINTGLARRIPEAQSCVIEGAGHMAPISHPKECAAQMRSFWNL